MRRVADLVHTARYCVAPTRVTGHLQHERHPVDSGVTVQRRKDLGRGPDLNYIAWTQRPLICRCGGALTR
jgi:hypothetical protein